LNGDELFSKRRKRMNDIFETNAPQTFPETEATPLPNEDPFQERVFQGPPLQETVERWKKEILDRIHFMKENLDQYGQEKEALQKEVNRLEEELARAKDRIKELETQFAETLETFNRLLDEVSQALTF